MPRLLTVLLKTAAFFPFLASSSVFAIGAKNRPALATQVWLINTRCAGGCGDPESEQSEIPYWRLDESCNCGQWQPSDAAAFQASALPGLPTTILIHGYGTDDDWAVRHGYPLYGFMKRRACGCSFRLIIWSWPADRVERSNSARHADEGLPQRRRGPLFGPRDFLSAQRRRR